MKPAVTTTATGTERPDKRGRLRPRDKALLAAALATAAGAASAQGTGISIDRPVFVPGIRTAAVYSDNARLAAKGFEDDEFTVEVSPSLSASSNAPRARYNLFYQLRNFWRASDSSTTLARHALNGNGSFVLGDDRLRLDLTGFMDTLNASPNGVIAVDPASSFGRVAKLRHFSVSPWFRDRIGGMATYQVRYYAAHTGGDSGFALAKLDQRVSASIDGLGRQASPWNWNAHTDFQQRDFDGNVSRSRSQTGGSVSYRWLQPLQLIASIDHDYIEGVRNRKGEDSGYGPGAGFNWTPDSRTSVAGSISRRYYGTVTNARAAYRGARYTTGLQYSRSVLTGADATLLAFDPTALTSQGLGGANAPLESLVSSGLVMPMYPTLMQGAVTDAAVLDRRISAFYGLYNPRGALTVAAFASNRESTADLNPAAAAGLAGASAAGAAFIGELRERGITATYLHRLDPTSSLTLTVDRRTNSSPTAGFESRLTSARVVYLSALSRNTTAFGGLRRSQQSSNGASPAYDENAVFGGVDLRFP